MTTTPQVQIHRIIYHKKDDGKYEAEIQDQGIYAPSFEELLTNIDTYIPKTNRVNIFATVAEVHHEPQINNNGKPTHRYISCQKFVPFDIDNIDREKPTETLATIREALGLTPLEGYGIATGNGVQIFIKLKTPITDVAFFDKYKPLYKAMCARIDRALEKAQLPGKADTSVFKNTQIVRLPYTVNDKPDKGRHDAIYINGSLGPTNIDLFDKEPVSSKEVVSKSGYQKLYAAIDEEAVLDGCDFLKWCKESPDKVDEPQWYAMLGLLAFLPNAATLIHAYSKGHKNYSPDETNNKAEQVRIGQTGPRVCKSIDNAWGGCAKCPNFGKCITPFQIAGPDHIATINTGFRKLVIDEHGKPKKGPISYPDLRKHYKKLHHYKCIKNWLVVYNGVHWELEEKKHATSFAMKHIKNPESGRNERSEFADGLMNQNIEKDHWLKQDPLEGFVNFKNGVVDLNTGELLPHDKKYMFFNVLPYDYVEAPCEIDKYIAEILEHDPGAVEFLWRYIGSCFDPSSSIQKALFMVGLPNAGKSTILKIFETIFPQNVRSSMSIGDINNVSSFRFNAQNLYRKNVNISDEGIPANSVDMSTFKTCVSNALIPYEVKGGSRFDFPCRAKFIVSANNMVKMKDSANDFKRKFEILSFKTELKNKDIRVLDEYIPNAREAMAYKAIQSYMQMKKEKQETGVWDLKVTPKMVADKLEQMSISDSTLAFFNTIKYTGDGEHRIFSSDLYNKYKSFCEENGIRAFKEGRAFGNAFTRQFPKTKGATIRVNGSQGWGYKGVHFVDETGEIVEDIY